MASSSTTSQIGNVPYDILREIFVHCLPRYRLRDPQPDVTIAPMLLCQICSSWRMVALTTATLWSHLSYCLSIDTQTQDPRYTDWIVPEKEYAFFMWWKKNQRSMAPSLRLDLNWQYIKGSKHPDLELDPAGMISLFEYISSALYLEIASFYGFVLEERTWYGYPIVYPNPKTMVVFGHVYGIGSYYDIQLSLLPNAIFSALRQLSINDHVLPHDSVVVPNCWSTLTHISLEDVEIALAFWFSLIRAMPGLQWANLNIQIQCQWSFEFAQPTAYTLPHLSTFFLTVRGAYDEPVMDHLLSIVFTELHLPALRNLSLSSNDGYWYDYRAVPELYLVLHAIPIITTLTLGRAFFSFEDDDSWPLLMIDIEPVWSRTPRLVHLRLEVGDTSTRSEAQVEKARETLIQNLFHRNNSWLDLENPACPFQEITLVDKTQSDPRSNSFTNFTMSSIQKHAENTPNVRAIFKVVLESEIHTASEVWNEAVQI